MPSNFWANDGIAMSQEAASLLVFGPSPLSFQDKFQKTIPFHFSVESWNTFTMSESL